jgi:hypothetical protein
MSIGKLSSSAVAAFLVAGALLVCGPACSNDSQDLVRNNQQDDQNDDTDEGDDGDDETSDTGPVAADADGVVDGSARDAASDATPRDAALDTNLRDTSLDGAPNDETDGDGSSGGEDGQTAPWDVSETCEVEKGPGDNPSCSEPTSCPGPDNSRDPEITCYTPRYTPAGKNVTLHIYGKYLVKEGGPPREIAVRQADSSGVGRSNGDVTVHSDCHVSATVYLDDSFAGCGDKIEVRLVRERNLEQDGDTYRLERDKTDWKEILLTQP